MPRAFLVKKKSRLDFGVTDEFDNRGTNDSVTTEMQTDRDKKPNADISYGRLLDNKHKYTPNRVLKRAAGSDERQKTLPCLTIPKPFADQTSNVLRSILYRGPKSPTRKLSELYDELSPSSAPTRVVVHPRSAQPLTTSAHSAFDKVVPGLPKSRQSPSEASSAPTQNLPISGLSQLQRIEQLRRREQSQMPMVKRFDPAIAMSFRQRGEDALKVELASINSHPPRFSRKICTDEPLNLKVKRNDESSSSRPESVESVTSDSRDSVSPEQSECDHIPKKKYFLDRQNFPLECDRSIATHNLNLLALRTPRFTPSVASIGPNPPGHLNWAYAAYYQQPQCGAPYGSFYSRLSQHPGISDDFQNMLQHQAFGSYMSPINASLKKEIPDSTSDQPRLSRNSPKSPPKEEDDSNEKPLKSPNSSSDNLDFPDPEQSLQKPEYRDYLIHHLKSIRGIPEASANHIPDTSANRPIARQPILGLEYIQNGTDVKVNDVTGAGCLEEDDDEIDDQETEDGQQKNLDHNEDDIDNVQDRNRTINDTNGNLSSGLDAAQIGENPVLIAPVPSASAPPVKLPQPKKYKCDICLKGFSRSNTLVTHKRIHTGDKPFKCELCGRAFRQPGNLTRHRLTHTTVKPYVCPQCDKAFNRASNLHTHMRTHTNYKPFTCPYCGKGFHQKIDMKIHSYTHTGEKPHKCKTCGRGFKQLTHLTYHMRTHSAVKMYTCAYCGKGFNQKGNLQAHIYGHTGERPYRCEICDKGFTLASTLNTHRRTHAEKKPFQCQYCQKDFYQKNALKSHLIASHPYTGESLL